MSKEFFEETTLLEDEKSFLRRKIYNKLFSGIEVVGTVSLLLFHDTILSFLKLGKEAFEKIIPRGDIYDLFSKS